MGEFFQEWQRKAGCVTLLMTLALMGAWIRSLLVEDLVLRGGQSDTYFTSGNGSIQWDQITLTSGKPINLEPNLRWEIRRLPDHDGVTLPIKESRVLWRRIGFGFQVAVAEYPDSAGNQIRRGQWAISYWAITVPLTLLSAYLILRKPRPKPRAAQLD